MGTMRMPLSVAIAVAGILISSVPSAFATSSDMASMESSMASSSTQEGTPGSNVKPPPVIPQGAGFDPIPLPPSTVARGGDNIVVNFGAPPAGKKALVALMLFDADGVTVLANIYGPDVYPTGKQTYQLPVLVVRKPGVVLRVITISDEGSILEPSECPACDSPKFDLELGGDAADAGKVAAAEAGPPAGAAGTVNPDDVVFFFRISELTNEIITQAEARQAFISLDLSNLTPAQAINLISTFDDVYNEQVGRPAVDEVDKLVALVASSLNTVDGVAPVLSRVDSNSIISALRKFLAGLLLSSSKKFNPLLTAAETAANVAQKLLEQLRQAAAQSEVAVGTINLNNICSTVVTVNTGGLFCNGGLFPHEVTLAGNALPITTHRVTAVAMTLVQMDAADQTLTSTLDLTAAVSPHYSGIATPTTSEATAHTLASKFNSANTAGAQATNANYNCYQRIATNNGEPSASYTQLAAASQSRDATSVTCTGANAGQIRWVTLATPITTPPTTTAPTSGASSPTTTTPTTTTPTTPAAAAGTTGTDDDSGSSALVGGIVGGIGGLLLVMAIVGLLLWKVKSSSSPSYGAENYWQGDGVYKGPIATPNGPW